MVHPTSLVLARLKREPLADLPIAGPLEQAALGLGHRWRDRVLTPLVMGPPRKGVKSLYSNVMQFGTLSHRRNAGRSAAVRL